MAYRAYRPSSAQMRVLKKVRLGRAAGEIQTALSYDPWQSIYRQTYGSNLNPLLKSLSYGRPPSELDEVNKSKQKKQLPEKPALKRPMTSHLANRPQNVLGEVKQLKTGLAESAAPKASPKVEEDKLIKFVLKRPKNLAVRVSNEFSKPKEIINGHKSAQNIKENVRPNAEAIESVSPVVQERHCAPVIAVSHSKAVGVSQTSSVSLRRPSSAQADLLREPKVPSLPNINLIGQNEEYLDPKDCQQRPPYTRVVAFDPKNFLEKNMRTLVGTKNEYFSYLTGKCLCGQCTCGLCRCVHFKVNSSCRVPEGGIQSEYKLEFVPYGAKQSFIRRRVHDEILRVPSKMDLTSTYKKDYRPMSAFTPPSIDFLNKSKISNLGIDSPDLRCPLAKESSYKLDYPDWKCAKRELIAPFVPQTMMGNLPFFTKTHNAEYGMFYEEGDVIPVQRAANSSLKKSEFAD